MSSDPLPYDVILLLSGKRSIKKRDAKKIIDESGLKILPEKIGKVKNALILEVGKFNLLMVNAVPLIVFRDDLSEYFPFVESYEFFECPKVTVDIGAVPYILRGADVMAPGITSFNSFNKSEVVIIFGESIPKAIAVGKAILSSGILQSTLKGKVIKNMHHVGDKIWKTLKMYSRTT